MIQIDFSKKQKGQALRHIISVKSAKYFFWNMHHVAMIVHRNGLSGQYSSLYRTYVNTGTRPPDSKLV